MENTAVPPFDFIIHHQNNLFTVRPVSLPAGRYADQFFPRNPALWTDGEFHISASEFADVVHGIQNESMTVGGLQ